MSVMFPWCDECKNLLPIEDNYCCKAFPNGKPTDILFDKNIKTKNECNKGIKFETK